MFYINNLEDLKEAINHQYRASEYLTDGTNIYEVYENDNDNLGLIETFKKDELTYHVNWEDNNLFTEYGQKIEPVYE